MQRTQSHFRSWFIYDRAPRPEKPVLMLPGLVLNIPFPAIIPGMGTDRSLVWIFQVKPESLKNLFY
jgi:hypothetical protein